MMKKSILATLFAGLFALHAAAGDERHMMKLELKKQIDGPTVVNVEENGSSHTFEFTAEELKDEALVANRLAGLDEQTRSAVIKALSGAHGGMVFIDEETLHQGDGENKVVIVKDFKFNGDHGDGMHKVMINVDGENVDNIRHKIIEAHDGKGFAFSFGDGQEFKMLHNGETGDHAKVIEKLLQHSELTQAQIDKLQQLLDQKRK